VPVYLDTETRGRVDLRAAGTYAYVDTADVIVVTYAVDDMSVRTIATGKPLTYADLPPPLRDLIEDDQTVFIAWNAGFDRAVLNYALPDCPYLPPRRFLDAMAQAVASCMPADLESASRALGGAGKQEDGKDLIKKFCMPESPPIDIADPDWPRFLAYAGRDIVAMREVWLKTRPLTPPEWACYHASEAINERGVAVDLDFVKRASDLARSDVDRTNAAIVRLTGGVIGSIYQHFALGQWLYERLPDEAREILTVALKDNPDDEADEVEPLPILSLDRRHVGRLLAWVERSGFSDQAVIDVLKLREFGASSSPKKFHKILDQITGKRLRGQYIYNGASTGRFSGKGVQLQNLSRTPLGGDYGIYEELAIECINDGCDLDALHAIGDGEVPSRKLSLLIRPAFIAASGKTLVKADYSQVEARGLPFLAASRGAEARLDLFRHIDRDPKTPDIYVLSAAQMLNCKITEVSGAARQGGKVAELACGYGGGTGALLSMAANYNLYFSASEALEIVGRWRAANPWAQAFWGRHNNSESYGLWGAIMRAYQAPGTYQRAGRVHYAYEPRLYGGTVVCVLPSKRLLFYPHCKWRQYAVKDKRTGEVIETKESLVYRRGTGMVPLWPGLLAENVTQATCADLLRDALVHLETAGERTVLHSHDEIVVETNDVDRTIAAMRQAMLMPREWTEGFPLAVDVVERWFYSASKERKHEALGDREAAIRSVTHIPMKHSNKLV
jgi:DNA polymerase